MLNLIAGQDNSTAVRIRSVSRPLAFDLHEKLLSEIGLQIVLIRVFSLLDKWLQLVRVISRHPRGLQQER